ncbi:hypothetical protein [Flagellimonas lutimaris]|jgi:hypothetical protein|uniref:hypothetical protein n=1 Tax=Flagellimonas TaxID=444459 RepID=UPI000B71F355|nr:MAG: hypothetical protein CBB72_002350 [Muricauda sp. TMED12]|tara:strand:- start:401593 stop:402129 length:537 start_codon:yes stop_codon:yes gene_type:complete
MKAGRYKVIIWIMIGIIALFLLFALWYKQRYAMEIVEPYTVNSKNFEKKLLIASQGSDFKDTLVQDVIDHYKNDSVFIQVIDVSGLPQANHRDFGAILLVHTWEYNKPPQVVEEFIGNSKVNVQKVIAITTSGEGHRFIEGVDGISGESKIEFAHEYSNWAIMKLNSLLFEDTQSTLP